MATTKKTEETPAEVEPMPTDTEAPAPVKVDLLPPEAQGKSKIQIAYLGNSRVFHTFSGKVFEWGTKHTLTAAEARDLFARTADGDFEVV